MLCDKKCQLLGIGRDRVQFILTTASMPDKNEKDREAVMTFARQLTAADDNEFNVITLGRRILRTETAGMMVLSVLMYHLEE